MREKITFPVELKTAGLGKKFYIGGLSAVCGSITNGVAFHMGDGGGWVVDKAQLRKILGVRVYNKKPKKKAKAKK